MIKKNLFKNVTFALSLLAAFALAKVPAYALDAAYEGDDYNIIANYNEKAAPGDAVFVRMNLSQTSKKNKVTKEQFAKTTATLVLYNDNTKLREAEFYVIPNESKGRVELNLLAGIPLSTWWKGSELTGLKLKVLYNLYGTKTYSFDLAFSLIEKEFVSETIPLNDSNTAIKTDTSTERMNQIEKLNAILATADYENGVHGTAAFVSPTTITRLTSFFGDRRVYAYSNGKSSTSLHYGKDYGAPTGTPVTCCGKGKVVMAENRISTGWSVVVEHLPGLYSLYYHMSELKVSEGQEVKPGDLLGLSGATGLATGPHLHWEMRLNGEAVNPDFFLTDFAFESK